jgi:hypothetical protein
MSINMPDELTLEPEIEQGWEATGELIPQGMRRAFSFNVFGAKWLDRFCSITTRRLKFFYDIFKDRLYWTDVSAEDMLYVPEVAGVERPPQDGAVRGQVGKLLRKLPPVEEPVYFVARAKFFIRRGAALAHSGGQYVRQCRARCGPGGVSRRAVDVLLRLQPVDVRSYSAHPGV